MRFVPIGKAVVFLTVEPTLQLVFIVAVIFFFMLRLMQSRLVSNLM